MIICSGQQLAKMYGGNLIFEDIQFEIHEKARVGLVGRNGSGKTTLFRLLAKQETPDTGAIHWKKGCEIGYLAQIPYYPNGRSANDVLKEAFSHLIEIENRMKLCELAISEETVGDTFEQHLKEYGELQEVFSIEGGYEMDANIDRVANGLNISHLLDKAFESLSGGEKTKVCLGQQLLKTPDLLLLDEPTNHLDMSAVDWLSKYLHEYAGAVVIISHDRYFLDETVNRIINLEDGELTNYNTNYTGFVKEKEERLLREFQQYEEQQKKIKKMKETIKRLKEWANQANPPNAGLHKRAASMEKALERMEKLDRPIHHKKMNMTLETTERSGKDAVILTDVSKSFNNIELFNSVNMHIRYQERTVIVGDNGTGKSTLLKIILEELVPDSGEVKVGSNRKVGYLSQHVFSNIANEHLTVIEAFRENVSVTEGEARHILAKFLFYGHAVFRKVKSLSGGERMRLRLAQLMYEDINFLILDEPTNHLDIESREVLEDTLKNYEGTILAVSHDRYFIKLLFNKVYIIDDGKVHFFDGDFEWARKKLIERKQKKQQPPTIEIEKKQEKTIPRTDDSGKIENEIVEIENQLNKMNEELGKVKELNKLQHLYNEKEELEQQRHKLYEKWESLLS